jgi:hypothetical protein
MDLSICSHLLLFIMSTYGAATQRDLLTSLESTCGIKISVLTNYAFRTALQALRVDGASKVHDEPPNLYW